MDPIAHTLAGATLSQTGLKKLTPLATACLVIGANLPDIDGVTNFLGRDTALYYRRGITHGLAAMAILPIILTGIFLAYDRFWRLKRHPHKKPVKPIALLGLSYLSVFSHPLLDWLNTYGVRLLMPFDARWFYGDTLFIIDPWMWLLMSAGVVYTYSKKKFCKLSWLVLALSTSLLVSLAPMVSGIAKLAWWMGVGAIVSWKIKNKSTKSNQRLASICLGIFALYLAAMSLINIRARQIAESWLKRESPSAGVISLMTGPIPANPFFREVIFKSETYYYGLGISILNPTKIDILFDPIKIEPPNDIIKKAVNNSEIKGFVNWMRFPIYEINSIADKGYEVLIRDLRYVRPNQTKDIGIGFTKTFVPVSKM